MIELITWGFSQFGNHGEKCPIDLDNFDLIFVDRGRTRYEFEEPKKSILLEPQQFLLLFPHSRATVEPLDVDARATVFHFKLSSSVIVKGSFLQEWVGEQNAFVHYSHPQLSVLTSIEKARDLMTEKRDDLNRYMLEHLLYLMLGELQLYHSKLTKNEDEITRLVKSILTSPQEDWDIDRMTELTGLTPSTFKKRFKEHTGTSPSQYVSTLRMKMAAKMLADSLEPIKSVAAKVGYPYLPHFYRNFSKFHGKTPAEYRNMLKSLM